MAKKGHVVDVTTVINADEYVGGILDSVTWDGKIWAAPFTMWLKPGFWYRKSFFQAHALSEPKTWDEFKALLDKIKGISGVKNPIVTGDGVGWPISDVTEHFIIAFGGPQLQLDLISGKVKFNEPRVRSVFENYLVPLIKGRYFSEPVEWTAGVELWWKGDYALYFMGTWITGMVENPDDLGFLPLPGAKGVVGGTDYIFIPKYSANLNEALEFLKWLATEGQVAHGSTKAGKIPTWVKARPEALWKPMQDVYRKVQELGLSILPDMDDTVGGDWQPLFWDQLKLLWVDPGRLDSVLDTLTKEHPAAKG
jgi:multiple sugar transport system substrate-binding protein